MLIYWAEAYILLKNADALVVGINPYHANMENMVSS
jgi:hypothetical protein